MEERKIEEIIEQCRDVLQGMPYMLCVRTGGSGTATAAEGSLQDLLFLLSVTIEQVAEKSPLKKKAIMWILQGAADLAETLDGTLTKGEDDEAHAG